MKKSLILLLASITLLSLPVLVFAQAAPVKTLLDKIIKDVMTPLLAGLGVICLVAAGIMFLTSSGSPEKISRAKAFFAWGVVGIAVGLGAQAVFNIVKAVIPAA